jgi:hypothetical protein
VHFAELQRATDAGLFDLLARAPIADSFLRGRLQLYLDSLAHRRLPRRVAVYPAYANAGVQDQLIRDFFGAGSAAKRRQVEWEMSEELRRRTGQDVPIMLYCPSGNMQLKQAKILVQWPGHEGLAPLSHFQDQVPRVTDLERSYSRMWKFYVHALTNESRLLNAAMQLCAERFPAAVNVLLPREESGNAASTAD